MLIDGIFNGWIQFVLMIYACCVSKFSLLIYNLWCNCWHFYFQALTYNIWDKIKMNCKYLSLFTIIIHYIKDNQSHYISAFYTIYLPWSKNKFNNSYDMLWMKVHLSPLAQPFGVRKNLQGLVAGIPRCNRFRLFSTGLSDRWCLCWYDVWILLQILLG